MKPLAFVFARGGSKGLPGKNIKSLGGKPLVQHSIDTALETKLFEKVFLSTDDRAIAEIGLAAGAEIIPRPPELATDNSSEWLAWRHAITWTRERYGQFSPFVSIPATSPLRISDDIKNSLKQLQHTGADICISVTPASRSPYFKMVKSSGDDLFELVNRPNNCVNRRQDAPRVFDITTVVYAADPDFILHSEGIFDGKVTGIEIPKERAVDIDDIYDFIIAEALLNNRESKTC